MSLAIENTALPIGLHRDVPMATYLALDAIGSGRLNDLAVSPLHYSYRASVPSPSTDATERGVALHMLALEPDKFWATYCAEPNPREVAPDAIKPRATTLYKNAVKALEDDGKTVLKIDEMEAITEMGFAIRNHEHAARILRKCGEREITAVWERSGRLCRGRPDLLGDGVLADLKTVRSLRDFSPWTVTRMGYHRKMAFYHDGLYRLGRELEHVFLIAIEATAPYDVGCFVFDGHVLAAAHEECERLLERLDACEKSDAWPGQCPDIQPVAIAGLVDEPPTEEAVA